MSDENKREHKAPENMTFVLWPNSHKKQGDNQPSMRGFITIDGKEYRIAGWTRWTPNGIKHLSGTAQPIDEWNAERQAAQRNKQEVPNDLAVDSDDMPF